MSGPKGETRFDVAPHGIGTGTALYEVLLYLLLRVAMQYGDQSQLPVGRFLRCPPMRHHRQKVQPLPVESAMLPGGTENGANDDRFGVRHAKRRRDFLFSARGRAWPSAGANAALNIVQRDH